MPWGQNMKVPGAAVLMRPHSPCVSGAAVHIHYASADGICPELWEVLTWEATFNEGSDLYPQSWINNQTST